MLRRAAVARTLPVAIVATFVIHFAFYKLLRVPLPWGVLQRYRLLSRQTHRRERCLRRRPSGWCSTRTSSSVMLASALFGLFVGAVPGLTATMATALLVPVTFFMPPVPAIAAIVTATAMAIFSGDIPSCLLRMPGTPASAAYTDEAYAMTQKGQAEIALGAGLVFSAIGGLFGTAVLIVAAPALAEVALKFSSFEYFWLVLLGLTCAVFIASASRSKASCRCCSDCWSPASDSSNPAGLPALHLRQHRADRRPRADPDDDRHVRGLGDPALARSTSTSRWEDVKAEVGNVFKGMGR